jgi:hypothetical protein
MEAWRGFVRQGFRSGAADVRTALRPYFTRRQLVILSRNLRFDLRAPPSSLTFGQWLAMFRFHAQACRGPTLACVCGSERRDATSGMEWATGCATVMAG